MERQPAQVDDLMVSLRTEPGKDRSRDEPNAAAGGLAYPEGGRERRLLALNGFGPFLRRGRGVDEQTSPELNGRNHGF